MAKQQGINEIKGTIGNLTYYKSQTGFGVRRKSSLSKEMILTNPRFLATRQNMSEFGSAGRSAKVFRNAIRPLLNNAKDSYMSGRLLKEMRKIIGTDATNARGNRNVVKGALGLLTGFNFNSKAPLESTFFAPTDPSIDRATGNIKLSIPSFIPLTMVPAPQGATHFRIFSSGCEVDFNKQLYVTSFQQSAPVPCDNNPSPVISQVHAVTPGSTLPLFLVMGIQFYQSVNGTMYPLQNKNHNALAIIAVDNN